MTEAEFLRLPPSDQAALVAVWQRTWESHYAPVCDPDRPESVRDAVTDWKNNLLRQSVPQSEGGNWKGDPTAEEKASMQNNDWKRF